MAPPARSDASVVRSKRQQGPQKDAPIGRCGKGQAKTALVMINGQAIRRQALEDGAEVLAMSVRVRGRVMPMASNLSNSDLAAFNLWAISRQSRAKNWQPEIGTVCVIP